MTVPIPTLPDWVPSAGDLNGVADASRTTQEVACPNTPLPEVYGTDRLLGKIGAIHIDDVNSVMYLLMVFCTVSNNILRVFVDNIDTDDSINGLIAKGGAVELWPQGGGPSALMQTAIVGYADTPTCCYVALRIPKTYSRSMPRVEAIIQGKRLYDPRKDSTNGGTGAHRLNDSSTWEYSDNPTLAMSNIAIGAGRDIDWASVIIAANFNDETVGSGKRRTIGITLATPQPTENWTKAFRVYTGCYIPPEGGKLRFIPDKAVTLPGDVARTFGPDDILVDSVKISRRNPYTFPTTVIVEYRDNSDDDNWRTQRAVYEQPGAISPRVSRVSLPGIHRYSQAYREAKERQKKFFADLSVEMTVFDEGLQVQIGSIVKVVHPIGLNDYFRIESLGTELGRWTLKLIQYDGDVYSNDDPSPPTGYVPQVGGPDSVVEFNAPTMNSTFFDTQEGVNQYYIQSPTDDYFPAAASVFFNAYALSKDGNTLVVACVDGGGNSLKVFGKSNGFTTPIATLPFPTSTGNIAISDDGYVIAVSSTGVDYSTNGYVMLYYGAGWSTTTFIGGVGSGQIGHTCALSGDGSVLIVSRDGPDTDSAGNGKRYVDVYYGPSWSVKHIIPSPSVALASSFTDAEGSGSVFGYRIAANYDGSKIAVTEKYGGTRDKSIGGVPLGDGSVHVFYGTTWASHLVLEPDAVGAFSDVSAGDDLGHFGVRVAFNRDGVTLVVHAEEKLADNSAQGGVYMFNGTNWANKTRQSIPIAAGKYAAGAAVTNDGKTVYVPVTGSVPRIDVFRYIPAFLYWELGTSYMATDLVASGIPLTNFGKAPLYTNRAGDLFLLSLGVPIDGTTYSYALLWSKLSSYQKTASNVTLVSGTTYDPLLTDEYIKTLGDSPVSINIPLHSTIVYPIGWQLAFRQGGLGQITLVPDTGVTILSPGSLKTRAQYSTITLIQTESDSWDLTGDYE